MKSIKHCSMDQIERFDRAGCFLEIHPPVGMLRQAAFGDDIRRVFRVLGFGSKLDRLEDDPVMAHSSDCPSISPLFAKAVSRLLTWHRQNVESYRLCEPWIESDTRRGQCPRGCNRPQIWAGGVA